MFSLAELLGFTADPSAIQRRQLGYRDQIAEGLPLEGASVLEIGCGQGDMSLILANRVGKAGRVMAIDPAPADYGAPFTLGESHRALLASPLGPRLDFRVDTFLGDLPEARFDLVFMVHSVWYMPPDARGELFGQLSRFSDTLVVAEWDWPREPMSHPAALATQVQALVSAELPELELNVRSAGPFLDILTAVEGCGWERTSSRALITGGLDDGRWEVEAVLRDVVPRASELSPAVREAVERARPVLEAAAREAVLPLPAQRATFRFKPAR